MAKQKSNIEKSGSVPTESTQGNTLENGVIKVASLKNTIFKDIPIGGEALIAGSIKSVENGEGTYGSFFRFIGEFGAKIGNQMYQSRCLFLPSVAADDLADQYYELLKEIDVQEISAQKSPQIDFKLHLVKSPDENSKVGYQWQVKYPIPPKETQSKVIAMLES